MRDEFNIRYSMLNDEQKLAVDTIDGPLLVLAGPGTGKTELLSVRVANILKKTDTLANNILCLTFTDSACRNMQDRLSTIIGEQAYDVNINTYHSFASEIILNNPDHFRAIDIDSGKDFRLEKPIDEIRQLEIVIKILNNLDIDNPLRGEYYANDMMSLISDLKQANISPERLSEIAISNIEQINTVNKITCDSLNEFKYMPRKYDLAINLFSELEDSLSEVKGELASISTKELSEAIELAASEETTKPLTVWKNKWLSKDSENRWTFDSIERNQKLISASEVYNLYQLELRENNEYDFNDMIILTLNAIEKSPDLKYNVQEKYQYILLDEFQDTNAAQFELISQIADNPVNEGKPNIMAVGDDDQGIFAFQGANINNMTSYIDSFRDVKIISLVKNYRSHHDIVTAAHNIAKQIESRLQSSIGGISKDIVAASNDLPKDAIISRQEFDSDANELGWIADKIDELIKNKVNKNEICIIAPKHKILESLVGFLNKKGIAVTYEKRENIIETKIVNAIYNISKLALAIRENEFSSQDELYAQILSYDYWGIDPVDIWKTNWEYTSGKFTEYKPWALYGLDNIHLKNHIETLINITTKCQGLSLEESLDVIVGSTPEKIQDIQYRSPIFEYYFSNGSTSANPLEFYEALSHLSVIRSHLREMSSSSDRVLTLNDFINFIDSYKQSNKPLINSHPIVQDENSVKLLTVYKSKGLEFEHVFLPFMNDDIWGKSAKSQSNKLSLPENLQHIRHMSDSEDTKRRLLFVAVTRAKFGLYITNHISKDNGKKTSPTKYMLETKHSDKKISQVLPENLNSVSYIKRGNDIAWNDIETNWFTKHLEIQPSLKSLLSERLKKYKLSPTNLNNFTNLEYAGPQNFLLFNLLKFPESASPSGIYGDAIHKSLELFQNNKDFTISDCVSNFTNIINKSFLSLHEKSGFIKKGTELLNSYLVRNESWLKSPSLTEVDFRNENVLLGQARLTGKIDRLEVDKQNKRLRIIDFKTGSGLKKWDSSTKSITYKQQLYFYKYLAENSRVYYGYTITELSLEFVEAEKNKLTLDYNESEYEEFKKLIESVWRLIIDLNLPDVSSYKDNSTGSRQFIKDLTN